MRLLSKREKLFLYLTLIIIICALGFNFLISPLASKLTALNQEISQKTLLLQRYSRLMSRGEGAFSLYESYRDTLETGAKSEEVVANLFEDIKAATLKFSLDLKTIKPLSTETTGEYKTVFLEVELEGDFVSVFKFINHLEDSPSFIRISSLHIFPQSQRPSLLHSRITFYKIFF